MNLHLDLEAQRSEPASCPVALPPRDPQPVGYRGMAYPDGNWR